MLNLKNFCIYHPRSKAKFRLIFFHHAGGSSMSYLQFSKNMPESIEVVFAELPGRASRTREPFTQSIEFFINEIKTELIHLLDRPTWVMGHSMGALLAYEAAVATQQAGIPFEGIFISGLATPSEIPLPKQVRYKSQEEIFKFMQGYGALPAELTNNAEAMDYYTRIVRQDLLLMEDYCRPKHPLLSMPLFALGGESDPKVKQEELQLWSTCAVNPAHIKTFSGDHFYLLHYPQPVIDYIANTIETNWSF